MEEAKVEKVKKVKRLTAETIQAKYPGVVEGSLRYLDPSGEIPDGMVRWVGKQVVQRVCSECGETFTLATSDLFQKSRCDACTKAHRKAANKAKRAEAKAILAAAKTE